MILATEYKNHNAITITQDLSTVVRDVAADIREVVDAAGMETGPIIIIIRAVHIEIRLIGMLIHTVETGTSTSIHILDLILITRRINTVIHHHPSSTGMVTIPTSTQVAIILTDTLAMVPNTVQDMEVESANMTRFTK